MEERSKDRDERPQTVVGASSGSKNGIELSPIKRALLEIRELRSRLAKSESDAERARGLASQPFEPIAIIGVGMRFPGGVHDVDSLWELLEAGKDAITEIPKDRWDWRQYYDADTEVSGSMNTVRGGFLESVATFDAEFFGIAPREAMMLDPQQRLLHEVAWHALEDASIPAVVLRDSGTGIFAGLSNFDYYRAAFEDDLRIDAYGGSGNSPSMAAGRLAYTLGTRGPAITLDTSCSSSLVAVHLACQSLRDGECDRALAAGVNLILGPQMNIAFSRAHMLAPDGACKTFDERANGYVRSEGCAVVVLRRLKDAIQDGDHVRAIIRGSAINHDGRSGGLTAPSSHAQAALLAQAYKRAGVSIDQVGMIEAHGTGTSLGDPIEMEGLAEAFKGRSVGLPKIVVGSIKTNIGHTEAASGLAGLLKAIVSLEKKTVPTHLHLNQRSSLTPWSALPFDIATEKADWPLQPGQATRIAGVSSFGFSGSNAHVVLEEFTGPVQPVDSKAGPQPPQIAVLSARSWQALAESRRAIGAYVRRSADVALHDLCQTLCQGRTHYDCREAWVVDSVEQLVDQLQSDDLATRPDNLHDTAVILCFTGQGSEYAGMGIELLAHSEVFRSAVERMDRSLTGVLDKSISEIWASESGELKRARYLQPALYAYGFALSQLWRSWGVKAQGVLGHSLGEYVAATVAGVMTCEEGIRLVAARGRLTEEMAEPGAMLSVALPLDDARKQLDEFDLGSGLSIAAVNGPSAVVISGALESVLAAEKHLSEQAIRYKRLNSTHGFHSATLVPMLDRFEAEARKVDYRIPEIRWISNVTGDAVPRTAAIDAGYWRRQLRETVAFERSVSTARNIEGAFFLEVGAEPHLSGLLGLNNISPSCTVASIRKGGVEGEWCKLLAAVCRLYTSGIDIEWKAVDEDRAYKKLNLPGYCFQRESFWFTDTGRTEEDSVEAMRMAAERQSSMVPIEIDVAQIVERQDAVNSWASALMFSVLERLGCFSSANICFNADDVVSRWGVAPVHRRLMERWLIRLADAELVFQVVGGDGRPGYKIQQGFQTMRDEGAGTGARPGDPVALWRSVERLLEGDRPLREYLANCAARLMEVLRGSMSPLETLFPNGDESLAANLYERSPGAVYVNRIAGAAVSRAVGYHCRTVMGFPRRMRILEIGAGTGSTTSEILSAVSPEKVIYTFSDVSEVFLNRAESRFRTHPMEFLLYDLDRHHTAQAELSGRYDVVVIANALHAAKDIDASLRRIRALLQPGGSIVLIETTKPQAWHDVSTGLIEGWQHFEDGIRDNSPLLGVEEWGRELESAGFEHFSVFPSADLPTNDLGLHVLLAHVPLDCGEDAGVIQTDRDMTEVAFKRTSSLFQSNASARDELGSLGAVRPLTWRDAPDSSEMSQKLCNVSQKQRRELILDRIGSEVSAVLGADKAPRNKDRLMDIGLDSLMAIELRNRLQLSFGLSQLPSTLIFDYPTPEAIAKLLLERLGYDESGLPVKEEAEVFSSKLAMPSESSSPSDEELDAMSDEDLAALIRIELEQ